MTKSKMLNTIIWWVLDLVILPPVTFMVKLIPKNENAPISMKFGTMTNNLKVPNTMMDIIFPNTVTYLSLFLV